MKLLKLVVVCLFTIINTTCCFAQAQNTQAKTLNCNGLPVLSTIEIVNDYEVSYAWSYAGNVSFRVLEYRSNYFCNNIVTEVESDNIGISTSDVPGVDNGSGPACPPDVWTEIPGPLFLKTTSAVSAAFKSSSGNATAIFKPCIFFEFRMKVVCNNDTLYSNVVPYYYNTGNCPDCIPAMNIIQNHGIDTTYQAAFNISSSAVVEANVTYMAGQNIRLNSGFSSKPGYRFKVMTEDCPSP